MRNRIFGAIGFVWGGYILINASSSPPTATGNAAYDAGSTAGLVFGGVLCAVGLYYLVTGGRKKKVEKDGEE